MEIGNQEKMVPMRVLVGTRKKLPIKDLIVVQATVDQLNEQRFKQLYERLQLWSHLLPEYQFAVLKLKDLVEHLLKVMVFGR